MSGRLLIFAALCLLGVSFAEVDVLTDSNFDGYIAENDLVLVEFYAPWCGHCKKLDPEYNAASKTLDGTEAKLAKVDATVEKALGSRFKIEGFPTIKIFRSGVPSPYEGGRTAKDIVGYMKKQMGPAIKPLASAADLEAFIPTSEDAAPVVVAFAESGSDLEAFITKYASANRDSYTFGLVSSAATAGDNAMGSIVLFKPFDELKNVYSGANEDAALTTFLAGNSMPAVAEIGPQNYQAYVKRGLPMAWLFLDLDAKEASDTVLAALKSVAGEFKEKVSLVYLSGTKYGQMATKMGLSGKTWPSMSIENSDGDHFPLAEDKELTADVFKAYLASFTSGELKPTMKSEAVPASLFDEHNVATVVGDNFKEVVLDDTKDVLIEFYAPWCGHCKSLVPEYNKLGKAMKGVKSVVIAKTDATANDYSGADFKVSGFPTIKLVTSKGNKVIDHSGDRTAAGFEAWLKAHVATPFEKPAEGAADKEEDDNDEL